MEIFAKFIDPDLDILRWTTVFNFCVTYRKDRVEPIARRISFEKLDHVINCRARRKLITGQEFKPGRDLKKLVICTGLLAFARR